MAQITTPCAFSPKRLREAREAAGKTRTDLGYEIRRGYKTIDGWEAGRNLPSLSVLRPLADALGVTIDSLFDAQPAAEAQQ